jgi:hypothetical protein
MASCRTKATEPCRLLSFAAVALTGLGIGTERSGAQTHFGWDYNLTHECVNSVGAPGSENYYADHSDCPVSGSQWQIAVNSKKSLLVLAARGEAWLDQSCPGPETQSLPINQNGILSLEWLPHVDEFGDHNWKVHLKTDLINHSHPCGSDYFTWYRFGDGSGPFPTPDMAHLSAKLNYTDSTPNGASRCFVWWDGFWDGKTHLIEINLAETNWRTNFTLPPGYLLVGKSASTEFVNVDGSYFGLTIPKNQDVTFKVHFWPLIQEMIRQGIFTAPTDTSSNGWATGGMYFGTEPHNFAASNSVAADLYVTNFRVTAAAPPAPVGMLANISGRLRAGTGNDVLIGGFIVGGSGPKPVVLRALGPTLNQFGVTGALQNPTLELRNSSGALIAFNDNWGQATNAPSIPTNLRPPNNLESAILATLNPGSSTAIVRGVNSTTGVALVEGYDIAPLSGSVLANISTRGLVQTGTNMIAGLIVQSNSEKVIVRALGPTLADFGVTNPLADPALELRDAQGTLLAANDNWKSAQQSQISATGKAPPNDLESAIVRSLAPGNYTATVRGVNNATGVALAEIYDLP